MVLNTDPQKVQHKPHWTPGETPIESFGDQNKDDIYYREGHPDVAGIDANDESSWNYRKLVIVGDMHVGKTALLLTFDQGDFGGGYHPTVHNQKSKLVIDGKLVALDMFDTVSDGHYDRLRPLSYPGAHILLVAFSVDARYTFDNVIENWMPEILHFCKDVPFILVGTKTDLRHEEKTSRKPVGQGGEALVTTEEGQELAKQIGAYMYLECSVERDEGVKEVFLAASRIALHGLSLKDKESKKGKGCVVL
ncbi:unnamed protein product [Periconia digitata]|uniref:Uncharacterized protein n=1 Tax=Periconia digitata TaxID=1303443 RepID=A0A9W4UM09_9PLEO|nr:unnamed protein product [Periconia digitata]